MRFLSCGKRDRLPQKRERFAAVWLPRGITTRELDEAARRVIEKAGATPSFLGYGGFPASICCSVNDEVIHGIPCDRKIKHGDIVKIDVGAF